MALMTRRGSCFYLRILFLINILGLIWYAVYRPKITLPWHLVQQNTGKMDEVVNDNRYWTTGPPHNREQMTVHLPSPGNHTTRVKAGFVVLVRNSELTQMIQSMNDVEHRFNKNFNYPWLFLNEEPFTEEFKERTTIATSGKTYYGFVDESMWSYPTWINQTLAAEAREMMKDLPYGKSESYRHMCRFQSGFFWRHPLFLELNWEYYWRVEPSVRYYCDLDYDPFLYMKENNKKYAFTISFVENSGTIPSLWYTLRNFVTATLKTKQDYFDRPLKDTLYRFITDYSANDYTQCHFWTNFEIARSDLWQSDAYQSFFTYLDLIGGFFYERWGDAPIHSLFAAMYLHKDEFHYFHDIGYKHSFYQHCPESETLHDQCYCDPGKTLDYGDSMSCLTRYMDALMPSEQDKDITIGEFLQLPE